MQRLIRSILQVRRDAVTRHDSAWWRCHAPAILPMNGHLWHPWLRIQRLIRSILEVRRDEHTRSVMKLTLRNTLKEREKIRRAGWWN